LEDVTGEINLDDLNNSIDSRIINKFNPNHNRESRINNSFANMDATINLSRLLKMEQPDVSKFIRNNAQNKPTEEKRVNATFE
jgi:exonuclease I